MKKAKKIIAMICLISGLTFPVGVQASTTSNTAFPNLESEQKAKGYTEVASTKETYLKFTPKESTKESIKKDKQQLSQMKDGSKSKYKQDDFIVSEVSELEYKYAELKQKQKSLNSISLDSYDEGNVHDSNYTGDSYLHLSIVLLNNSSDRYKFLATNYFTWVNRPTFSLTDGAGISVGEGMKIYANTYKGQIAHIQRIIDHDSPTGYSYRSFVYDATGMVHTPNGIAAKYDIWSVSSDNGYIECEVGFTQYNGVHQSSSVFGNYSHATVGFSGAISLSSSGAISLGAGKVIEQYSVGCDCEVN